MRPKYRVTKRVLNAAHLWHDEKRSRFVVYRRAGGILRKTSVRYGERNKGNAESVAKYPAGRLAECPAHQLGSFRFAP